MAVRQGGLGGSGRDRAIRNLFDVNPQEEAVLSDTLFKDTSGQQVAGHRTEEEVLGGDPAITSTEWFEPGSSRVRKYQYDYATKDLRVRFVKGDTPWIYRDVPVAVFEAFHASDSKGRFINSTLNYSSYGRATPQEESALF